MRKQQPEKIVIFFQFIKGNTIGHFILNIVSINDKTIYIANSLSCINAKTYVAHKHYQDYKVEILKIHQQPPTSNECCFHCMYYAYKIVKLYSLNSNLTDLMNFDNDEFYYVSKITRFVLNTMKQKVPSSKIRERKQR